MVKQAIHDPIPTQEESGQAYATWCFPGFHNQNASGAISLFSGVSLFEQISLQSQHRPERNLNQYFNSSKKHILHSNQRRLLSTTKG